MKAVLCHALGEPDDLRVEEIEPSHLEHGQVRIGVHAAGVNFPDYLMVTGKYQVKPPLPFTPGIEAAGEIIECAPDVVDLRPGQRVVALARRGGAFASQLTLPAPFVVPIPDTMDFATAAGFSVAYGTAHLALTHRGQLRSGETLLVTGAGGGVGLAAVEVALLRKTANSEILRLISTSPGDLDLVFSTILEHATRICNANFGTLFRFDGENFHPAAIDLTGTGLSY